MDITVEKVAMIVLGVMTVAAVFAGFSGFFESTISNFLDKISFPCPGC